MMVAERRAGGLISAGVIMKTMSLGTENSATDRLAEVCGLLEKLSSGGVQMNEGAEMESYLRERVRLTYANLADQAQPDRDFDRGLK